MDSHGFEAARKYRPPIGSNLSIRRAGISVATALVTAIPAHADIAATAARVGAFALGAGSKDAVVLATLSPGAYTASILGVNDTTGVALVEVYEVP